MEKAWEFAAVIALGFDPGGAGSFGCALLHSKSMRLETISLTSVDEVCEWVVEVLAGNTPDTVGVDAILHWQTTKSGWRGADEYLRKNYKNVLSSVQPSNSCAGSMAVQGLTLTMRLKERWPDIMVTETHPKVLWNHITNSHYPKWKGNREIEFHKLLSSLGIQGSNLDNDHEFDAAISAWAALNAKTKKWSRDLVKLIAKNQKYQNLFPAGNVHYYWPEKT